MKRLFNFITSMRIAFIFVLIFVMGLALGTYIENLHGFESAAAIVYFTQWFEFLMFLLVFTLIVQMIRFKFYEISKWNLFLLHMSFIVFFVGATLTRFYGFESNVVLKYGEITDKATTKVAYLAIKNIDTNESFFYPLYLNALGNNNLKWDIPFSSSTLHVILEKVDFNTFPKKVYLMLMNNHHQQTVVLEGNGFNTKGIGQMIFFGQEKLFLEWGHKEIDLPFKIQLNQLNVLKYPGSNSPSMIKASLNFFEEKIVHEKYIAVNQPIVYNQFIFFISSYDLDEKGLRLLLNYDPGKKWVYASYLLFVIGMIATIFSRKGRVRALLSGISAKAMLLLSLISFSFPLYATPQLIEENFADTFSSIIVQGNDGRMKPLDTVNQMIYNKIVGANDLLKINYNQVVLGMSFHPSQWQETPMFLLKHTAFQNLLHVKQDLVSFIDFFDSNGNYLLRDAVDEALRKDEFRRAIYEKELIKLDEKVNIAYLVYTGQILKIFPKMNDSNQRWFDPNNAMDELVNQRDHIGNLLSRNSSAIQQGLKDNNWFNGYQVINDIKAYQYKLSPTLLPSNIKIEAELFYNRWKLFEKLYPLYLVLGGIFLSVSFYFLISKKTYAKSLKRIFLTIGFSLFLIHTSALALRWYIADYAPWSNTYEGMLYIAWCIVGAGILFSHYLILTVPVTLLFGGVCLFVAHLSWMDPLITPLVPALQSHWLVIHVAVISASYGLLGLSALVGIMTLLLLIASSFKVDTKSQFLVFLKLNEISMIFGLFLLAFGTLLGSIWANESWGRYWGWDAKEVWSVITICLYGTLLHYRFNTRIKSNYFFTVSSIFFYGAVIMTYFGVNYYLSGLHSYGAIKMEEIPDELVYSVFALLSLIGWSFFYREVLD